MTWIENIESLFEPQRNREIAIPMEKYMKNHFPFLGIKTPERNELMKQFYKESGIIKEPFQEDFVIALWKKEEREYQYAALSYVEKSMKKLTGDHISLMEMLITTKSWWDTVDMIASKPVGKLARDFPEMMEKIEEWAYGDHLWLRRTAILFQLKYKEKTDEKRLYRYMNQNADSKEFFIQKAIGWALREYSKTNPDSVKHFIDHHKLANLSVREGSKYLK